MNGCILRGAYSNFRRVSRLLFLKLGGANGIIINIMYLIRRYLIGSQGGKLSAHGQGGFGLLSVVSRAIAVRRSYEHGALGSTFPFYFFPYFLLKY